jgi:hypothetical protein
MGSQKTLDVYNKVSPLSSSIQAGNISMIDNNTSLPNSPKEIKPMETNLNKNLVRNLINFFQV